MCRHDGTGRRAHAPGGGGVYRERLRWHPVAGLQDADFEIYEDGERNDREAQKVVLDRSAAAFVTIVLDNSSSLADANAQDAVADAALAYIDAAFECSRSVYVAVATFSRNFNTVLEHTSDIGQLRAAIEAYRQDARGRHHQFVWCLYRCVKLFGDCAAAVRHRMREGWSLWQVLHRWRR